jgi:hypothetical protein
VLLGLTARGRKVDVDRPGTVEDAVHRVITGSSRGAIASVRDVLTRLAAALEPASDEGRLIRGQTDGRRGRGHR